MMERKSTELNSKVRKSDVMVETIDNSQDVAEICREKNHAKEKETYDLHEKYENENEKLKCSIQSQNEVVEKMKLKEKEQEHKIKGIGKFKSKIKSLEHSDNMKLLLIDELNSVLLTH